MHFDASRRGKKELDSPSRDKNAFQRKNRSGEEGEKACPLCNRKEGGKKSEDIKWDIYTGIYIPVDVQRTVGKHGGIYRGIHDLGVERGFRLLWTPVIVGGAGGSGK